MSYGGDVPVEPRTSRGEGWPALRQFCVFKENRVGQLHELFRLLERNELRVIAMSVVDSVDFSLVRLMVDDPDRAGELFRLSNINWFENSMLGVCLPDDPQPMVKVCLALMQAEINIHYAYPLLYPRGAIAISVDDLDLGNQVLKNRGMKMVTEDDLKDDDHYLF